MVWMGRDCDPAVVLRVTIRVVVSVDAVAPCYQGILRMRKSDCDTGMMMAPLYHLDIRFEMDLVVVYVV